MNIRFIILCGLFFRHIEFKHQLIVTAYEFELVGNDVIVVPTLYDCQIMSRYERGSR